MMLVITAFLELPYIIVIRSFWHCTKLDIAYSGFIILNEICGSHENKCDKTKPVTDCFSTLCVCV